MRKRGVERTARTGPGSSAKAGTGAKVVEVAEAAHGGGDKDLAGDGEGGDGEDGAPLGKDAGVETGR